MSYMKMVSLWWSSIAVARRSCASGLFCVSELQDRQVECRAKQRDAPRSSRLKMNRCWWCNALSAVGSNKVGTRTLVACVVAGTAPDSRRSGIRMSFARRKYAQLRELPNRRHAARLGCDWLGTKITRTERRSDRAIEYTSDATITSGYRG